MARLPFLSLVSFCQQNPLPVLLGFPSQHLKCRFAARAPGERSLTPIEGGSSPAGCSLSQRSQPFPKHRVLRCVWVLSRAHCTCSDGPVSWRVFPFTRADGMHLYGVEKEKVQLALEREQTTPKVLCSKPLLPAERVWVPAGTQQADARCDPVICG